MFHWSITIDLGLTKKGTLSSNKMVEAVTSKCFSVIHLHANSIQSLWWQILCSHHGKAALLLCTSGLPEQTVGSSLCTTVPSRCFAGSVVGVILWAVGGDEQGEFPQIYISKTDGIGLWRPSGGQAVYGKDSEKDVF